MKARETATYDTCFPGLSVDSNVGNSTMTRYFPPGVFSKNEWQDQYTSDWYSKHLRAMEEPSLYTATNSQQPSYRFLWLRSFHRPVAIRLFRSGGSPTLTVKVLNGLGGHEPGNRTLDKTQKVTEVEWQNFLDLLVRQCFWRMSSEDKDPRGQDGAQWILEGAREGRYHIVDRWSPGIRDKIDSSSAEALNYRDACLYLLKLSGLEEADIY